MAENMKDFLIQFRLRKKLKACDTREIFIEWATNLVDFHFHENHCIFEVIKHFSISLAKRLMARKHTGTRLYHQLQRN